MAVIEKIRSKYAKLAGFVIALALVGFILMDAMGSMNSFFGGDSSVAKVNGTKIDQRDYSMRIKDYEVLYTYSSQGKPLDEATRAQINSQALNELINDVLVKEQAEKLGLQADDAKELIYSAEPDPIVQQYQVFRDPETGMFDPQRIKLFEQQVTLDGPNGKVREEWETIKAYVLRNNLSKKYNAMLATAVYVPNFVIKQQMADQSAMASIRFVKVPLTTIPDNQVTVTDEDLMAYMKKRAPLYTIQQPTRSIEYVSFDVLPSAEDTARALGALTQLRSEFMTTTDAQSFVNRNSEEQYVDAFVGKNSFMSMYADTILKQPVGTVYGPYFENGEYKLVKVLEKRTMPDSVKSRHILIRTAQQGQPTLSDTLAKAKIDSIALAIANGASFDTMVAKYSEDEGSKATGGEYTFTMQQKPTISKEFGDFIFDGSVGQNKIVKVENANYSGYHYIEILEQKAFQDVAKLGIITKALYPDNTTENAAFAKASAFAGRNTTAKAFDAAVKSEKLDKRVGENIKANDFVIQGIGSARPVISWMYDAKVGEVSPVFTLDGHYIVAKLTAKQDKGLMTLDANLRPVLEAAVKAEKKAAMIAEKYKAMQNLEAIAQASGQAVQRADSFNAATPYINNLGYEPKVVGYAFFKGFKPNQISPAIKGQDGVFFISPLNFWTMQAPAMQNMEALQRMQMQMQTRNAIGGMLQEAMQRNASIKYNTKNL